jgi:hypothetical protein
MRRTHSRLNFSLRLQPYSHKPLGEVVAYLNSLDRELSQQTIGDVLLMCLLPYARAQQEVSQEELHRTCWESCDAMNKHASVMRQALRVPLPPQNTDNIQPPSSPLPSIAHLPARRSQRAKSQNGSRPTSKIQDCDSADAIDELFN